MSDQGKLAAYAQLIRHWAPRLDLVSPADLERFEDRHIADSLRLLPLLEEVVGGPCIDVGSGAGLPGIPLAIATGLPWRLLEPRAKRAGFLDEVVRELALDCEVVRRRAQDAARDPALRAAHVVTTARALAPPRESFELAFPLLRPGGVAAVWHGPGAELPPEAVSWTSGIATMAAAGPPTEGETGR